MKRLIFVCTIFMQSCQLLPISMDPVYPDDSLLCRIKGSWFLEAPGTINLVFQTTTIHLQVWGSDGGFQKNTGTYIVHGNTVTISWHPGDPSPWIPNGGISAIQVIDYGVRDCRDMTVMFAGMNHMALPNGGIWENTFCRQ